MADDAVIEERHGPAVVLRLNRPQVRNALDAHASDLLGRALERADADPQVRAVVVTGEGSAFCSGSDLHDAKEILVSEAFQKWGFGGFVRHPVDLVTVAVVNGPARGGGTELALACDLVVAERSASFGLPEARRGLMPGAGGSFRLVAQLPRRLALEVLLCGRVLGAEEALAHGLVNRVVDDGEGMAAALALVDEVALSAPLSVAAIKRVVRAAEDEAPLWAVLGDQSRALGDTADAAEGASAFLERRAPTWTRS